MSGNRRADKRLVECQYERAGTLADPCVYCGAPASTFDHVPPLHYVARNPDIEDKLLKHPSCAECNAVLTGSVILTLRERREYIRQHLRRKYSSYLKMPKWDEDELAELSEKMAEEIRRSASFSEYVKKRVSYRG